MLSIFKTLIMYSVLFSLNSSETHLSNPAHQSSYNLLDTMPKSKRSGIVARSMYGFSGAVKSVVEQNFPMQANSHIGADTLGQPQYITEYEFESNGDLIVYALSKTPIDAPTVIMARTKVVAYFDDGKPKEMTSKRQSSNLRSFFTWKDTVSICRNEMENAKPYETTLYRNSKGLLLKSEDFSSEKKQVFIYTYDDKGNPKSVTNNGVSTQDWTILETDAHGNWTRAKRVSTALKPNGEPINQTASWLIRDISYY
jgi:hypothetical protein